MPFSPKQADAHVDELLDKYAPGSTIADTQNARDHGLAGQPLEGKMILEVPIQQNPVPQEFADRASRLGVTIRDFNGQVLNETRPR